MCLSPSLSSSLSLSLFCPLAVCLPVRCCCCLCCLSCLRIECIAFNIYSLLFPFSATLFPFFFPCCCAHFSCFPMPAVSSSSGGRGKLKMRLRLKLHDKRIAKCCMFSSSSSSSTPWHTQLTSPIGRGGVYHDTLNKCRFSEWFTCSIDSIWITRESEISQ